jgi:heavy metal sensor kinase
MSRVPIRLRLTATFAIAMAIVLSSVGFLLYHHLAGSLDSTVAQSLRARTADVTALVNQADTGLRESHPGDGGGFVQVLDANRRIFDRSPGSGGAPLLTPEQFRRALVRPLAVPRATYGGENIRLRAVPIHAQGQKLVVVVGAPLETRDNALAVLRTELFVGGPIALILASLIGYQIAGAALRPVERMRLRAQAISGRRLSERLPVSPASDEIARLGETLNDMLGRLEVALDRERSFVADASHELRTPLAHLRAEIELALESPRSHDELETALRSVGNEADRLSQLAEDLLLLARIDEGKLPLRRELVRTDELLGGTVARFQRRAIDAGRTIEVEHDDDRVDVDRLRVDQALGNLVDNALRYGAGTIRVDASQGDGWLELRVSDEGAGFPSDFAPHAFERFSRADTSRGTGGAGLGLAIVAAVAHAHGGTTTAQRGPLGGAEVSLRLPAGRIAAAQAARPKVSPGPVSRRS